MINTAITAFVLVTVYVVTACIVNRDIPESISQMVNTLDTTGVWLWTVVMILTAVLTMPAALNAVDEVTHPIAFLACASMVFMALTPIVKHSSELSYNVHMFSAITSAVSSQLLVATNCPRLLLCWVPFFGAWLIVYILHHHYQWKFWAEFTCFFTTFILVLNS